MRPTNHCFARTQPKINFRYQATYASTHLGTILVILVAVATLAQAQKPAPPQVPQSDRIIVKLRPSLAREVEAELPATIPLQEMHVSAGQAKGPHVQGFMQKYSVQVLTPLYPQIIRQRQKHGWTDAQFAEHLRQRFAARARRHAQSSAVPEVSRSYVLDLGSLSPAQRAQAVKLLQTDGDVEFAEAEHTLSKVDLPNDPFLSSSGSWGQPYQDLWGLYAIGAPTAWDTAQGNGVIVAVVDTGLDYNHPDLAANVWVNVNEIPNNFIDDDGNGFVDDVLGWNFAYNNNNPIDDNGHGTHVAGTIAAVGNNGIGIIGVAWHAQVMAVKALDFSGNGFDSNLAPAIMYAASNGADIINASWGLEGTDQTIEEAIQFADGLGVVFVAAAGNSSEDAMNFFPANSPEAITVAASDPFGNFAFFSNFGPKVDATAPGVGILSLQAANTFLPGFFASPGYLALDGTSMAAAHVSGVAALALSQNPAYSTDQVRQIIRSSDTSNQSGDSRFGYGSLNAAAAVAIVNPLEAKITGVQFGAVPSAPITITGFADGTGFSSYILEYGQGTRPFFWTQFFNSVTPASGTLGQLDPTFLASGTYSIRLTAFNTNGNAFIDRTVFTLTFTQITSPVTPSTYKPGFLLPIIGTAAVPNLQNFMVRWFGPDGVAQTTGITLTGNGLSPVGNAQLATWDTSGITQAGFYNIVLTDFGFQFEQASTTIYLEPDLLSFAWPIFLDLGPCLECPAVPALNPDGTNRLLVATSSAGAGGVPAVLWTVRPDGSSQKTVLSQLGSQHQPSAGSIDGLPGDEAVTVDSEVVDVFHPDGTLNVFNPDPFIFLTNDPLVLADLNNAFQLESVTVGSNLTPNGPASLYAWQPNGQQASGFPIQLQDQNPLEGTFNLTRVIVGDFDGDGFKDILVINGPTSTTYNLLLFNHDGTPKPFNAPILTGQPAAMAAADLDHNGKLETILLHFSDALGTQAAVHVLQPDGSERAGWPVDISASHASFFSFPGIAIGDLNRDGHEEIVLSNGSGLYVFNPDGTPFSSAWPVPMVSTTTYLRPLLADINGDGLQEIVVPFDDFNSGGLQLRAFLRDGTIFKTWLLNGMNTFSSTLDAAATIGDFNQDGSTDIEITYPLQPPPGDFVVRGLVTVLDMHSPFVAANNDWPMVLQNPKNNPVLLRTVASTLTVALSSGANPSVIGDSVTFTATLTPAGNGSVQFLDGGSPLSNSIPLTNGTASFATSALALGSHTITARYTGDNQHSPSVSAALTQGVVKGNTTIALALTGGTNPALTGDTLTFTATIVPASATGTIEFFDGSAAISGSLPVNGGSASFSTSTLALGTHSISAVYSGDNTFNGATSSALLETVNNPKTNTSIGLMLQAGVNPTVFGSSLTFTATVAPAATTGTVTFFDGSVPITGGLPLSGGIVTFTTSALGAGMHSITAQYSGDANFNGSASAVLSENVLKAATQVEMELAVGDTAFVAGTNLTFQATVTPLGATGSVMFFDNGVPISSSIALANDVASFSITTLSVGSHAITVQYSGDANYNASSSPAHKLSIK